MTIKLYASSGASFRGGIPASEVVAESIPAATTTALGGVLKGAAVANSASAVATTAPAGGTGATAGAYDTAGNRDTAIATINATRTLALELQTQLNALLAQLRASGTITT